MLAMLVAVALSSHVFSALFALANSVLVRSPRFDAVISTHDDPTFWVIEKLVPSAFLRFKAFSAAMSAPMISAWPFLLLQKPKVFPFSAPTLVLPKRGPLT